MSVKCYLEGEGGDDQDYLLAPGEAALLYCQEWHNEGRSPLNVCVEPLDDDAKALPGWHADEDGVFRMFVVTPVVTVDWSAREVATFNTARKTAPVGG